MPEGPDGKPRWLEHDEQLILTLPLLTAEQCLGANDAVPTADVVM